MKKTFTSLSKLRKKIQTNLNHKEGLCAGCIFIEGKYCSLPHTFLLDARFNCAILNPITGYATNFIFIKEEK